MKTKIIDTHLNSPFKYLLFIVMLIFLTAIFIPSESFFAHSLTNYAGAGVAFFVVLGVLLHFLNETLLMYGALFTAALVALFLHETTSQSSILEFIDVQEAVDDIEVTVFDMGNFNGDYESINTALKDSHVDVIALQQVSDEVIEGIKQRFVRKFNYSTFYKDTGNNGLGFFSKHEITSVDTFVIDQQVSLALSLHIKESNKKIGVFNTRVPHHMGNDNKQVEAYLREISRKLEGLELPYFCVGNFNMVPWDRKFIEFRGENFLSNSKSFYNFTEPGKKEFTQVINFNPKIHILYSNQLNCTLFHNISIVNNPEVKGATGAYRLSMKGPSTLTNL